MSTSSTPPSDSPLAAFSNLAAKLDKNQLEKMVMVCIGLLGTHPWYASLSPDEIYSFVESMSESTSW